MLRRRFSAPIARIVAVAVAFLLGCYGFAAAYHAIPGRDPSLATDAFRSLQLVVGQFPAELQDRPLPWSLHLARWALPLLTFWTTVALAWLQVRNPVRLRWIARRGEHLVLFGDDALAARIADGARQGAGATIVWADDVAASWVARAADAGMPHVSAAQDGEGADQLGLERARAVLLVGGHDTRNMTLAAAAVAEAGRVRPHGDPLPVAVRIDDLDLRASIEARYAAGESRSAARLRVVSLPDVISRRLFLDQPLDRFLRSGEPRRGVFVVGLTPATERYVLRLLAAGHFRDGRKPQIVILDPEAAAREQVFRARRPGADTLAPVAFRTAATHEPALIGSILDAAIAEHGPPVSIVIDPADDSRALALAHAVEGWFEGKGLIPPPIHARVGTCPEDQLGAWIHPFGDGAAVADPELLLQERHDALARAIHDFYFDGRLAEGDVVGSRVSMHEWEDLPETVRDDNRLVADCYQLKLRDIGARVVPGDDSSLRLDAGEIEELARAEHDRWAAAKLIDGWVFGESRDDATRRHPDLIAYDALSERIRELDREQVRLITRLLPGVGLSPRRTLNVLLEPGEGAGGAPIADAAPWFAAHYPDRVPLFLGQIDAPGVRNALETVAATGLVQLILTPAAARPAGDDRVRFRRLVRGADAVHALPATDADALARIAGGDAIRVRVAADGGVVAAPWLA